MRTHRFTRGLPGSSIATLVAAAAFLTACAGGAWFKGTGVMDLGPVIVIQPGGPHHGATGTGGADLAYAYQADYQGGAPSRLRLTGQLLEGGRRGTGLGVYVLFLGAGEQLLDKEVLLSTGGGGYGTKRDFDEVLTPPSGTLAFRFGSASGPERGHR